ncbi:hypothetical protein [Paraburkholderia azotifigens]|uniref:hypothetical protein n=1 Tax=Paraburkholderia azotifigens TaxID=2057004 RepID=UPI003CCC857C
MHAFSWASPFVLLVVLSCVNWMGGLRKVPSLTEHLQATRAARALPNLWRQFANPRHLNAFALTFVVMVGDSW